MGVDVVEISGDRILHRSKARHLVEGARCAPLGHYAAARLEAPLAKIIVAFAGEAGGAPGGFRRSLSQHHSQRNNVDAAIQTIEGLLQRTFFNPVSLRPLGELTAVSPP